MWQRLKGWRTVASSAFLGTASAVLACYDYLPTVGIDLKEVIGEHIPTQYVGTAGLVIALTFAGLRFATTTKVGCDGCEKKDQ